MSFSPRNVSQLLVGTTTKADIAAYKAGSAVGDYLVIPTPAAGAVTGELANAGAKLLVRTSGGDKVSDTVITANISSITEDVLVAGTLKQITAQYQAETDFVDKTFVATIDFHDHIGSMLNDRFMSAYVSCDKNGNFLTSAGVSTVGTVNAIVAELAVLLQATVDRQGGGFTITAATDTLTITELAADHMVGVKDGINNPWEFIGGEKDGDNISGEPFNMLPATVTLVTAPTADDLVQLKNVEWFNSGYDKDPYRETGYPHSFQADSNVTAAGIALGDAYCIVQFYKDRDATNIERQHRQLIIAGAAATEFKAALEAVVPV